MKPKTGIKASLPKSKDNSKNSAGRASLCLPSQQKPADKPISTNPPGGSVCRQTMHMQTAIVCGTGRHSPVQDEQVGVLSISVLSGTGRHSPVQDGQVGVLSISVLSGTGRRQRSNGYTEHSNTATHAFNQRCSSICCMGVHKGLSTQLCKARVNPRRVPAEGDDAIQVQPNNTS
ncbi:hypothetical protein CYMTET_7065 [Cymbomonas tetramitiformis]|uniref:Uncharacterized protein n=1 Tax=Cymbomonas tetramitiformis TaxID=36881 RepID=A0AAE0LHG2_9CHLO|nr:hypothetical protein CYMTET_7065 [Cymbomonas tetramitiformis]